MSGCHKGDSDTLLRSVSSEIKERAGQLDLFFVCRHWCATLGGESHSIARQMQPTLPPIGGSELVVVFKGFRREYIPPITVMDGACLFYPTGYIPKLLRSMPMCQKQLVEAKF